MDKGSEIRDQIRAYLERKGVQYRYLEHEETKTSEDSARIRGTKLAEGAKAIILKGKNSGVNIMVVVPADKRINLDAIKALRGEKFEFENPQIILDKFGLQVGAVPPFGDLLGIQTYVDGSFVNNPEVSFNCGLRTCSLIMSSQDFMMTIIAQTGNYV